MRRLLPLLPLSILYLLSRLPGPVESWAQSLSPVLNQGIGRASSLLPISLAEVGGGGLILLLGGYALNAAIRARRAGWPWHRLLGRGLHRLVQLVLLGLTFFYAVWGLNYARAPIATRLGWEEAGNTTPDELMAVGLKLAELSNNAYQEAFGTDDLGVSSDLPPLPEVQTSLERAYTIVQMRFAFEPSFSLPRPAPKPLQFASLFTRLGLLGFYSPFTGEANFHASAPGQQLGHAIAHEKAHQRGIGPEDEANFVGYLVAGSADMPYLRYSAYLFAFKQVYYQLYRVGADYGALLGHVATGPRRDMEVAYNFWHAHEGILRDVSRTVNDSYLKVNGQEGIEAYNQSLRLILSWTHRNKGDPSLAQRL